MSKTKTILFRADSSSKIGTGHIMRDLVLAQKYAKKGAKIIFATQKLQGNINHRIQEAGFKLLTLKSNSKKELVKLIKKHGVDLLVIDHYGIDHKKEHYIKEKTGVKILSFDDTYEKHHCDILLNHNISAQKKHYKNLLPKGCEIRCGKKYTLLRDEFYKEKKKNYPKDPKSTTVFLAMGGADTAQLNIKILKLLQKFDTITVNLVTTSANRKLAKLQKFVQNKPWIKLHINASNLAELMAQSDFAIITPSVILNEVSFMKLPFIAIQTAENQKEIVKFLEKKKKECLHTFDKEKLSFFIYLQINKLQLLNFTTLRKKEKQRILSWRNHPNIRKWMHNSEIISYQEHKDYIESLKKRNDRIYFFVKKQHKAIGVVDLTDIDYKKKSAELGIYANPKLKAQGKILLEAILQYGFLILKLQCIKVTVLKSNQTALNLYNSFSFTQTKETKEFIYMELHNENK